MSFILFAAHFMRLTLRICSFLIGGSVLQGKVTDSNLELTVLLLVINLYAELL